MATLEPFDVPTEILNIALGENDLLLREIERMPYRSEQMQYIRAYSTMIHLEEAEHSQSLLQFNRKNIHISHNGGRIFCINNDVSLLFRLFSDE